MSAGGDIPHVPVVVIGAGPVGVTAATLLAQYGIESLVLDRWAHVYPQPRAVHLDDEVFRILARLGVADDFAAVSRPTLGLRLLDESMNVLAEFHRDTALGRNGFPQGNMFDQPDLEAVLRANLERHPLAVLRGNVEVTEIGGDDGNGVRISYSDRREGSQHVVTTDYVLGCDGANSITRRRIGSRMRDFGFEQRWLVVDIATPTALGLWAGVHQLCDPVRAGTYMQIGDTRHRWEFRLLGEETAADFRTLDDLAPLIQPWIEHVAGAELDLVRVTEYTFRAQLADRWRRGRIFLLGDAAHLTPPFIGQGLGAGLRDAMNLSWKLAGVLDGTLPPETLDSYEQERQPHARHMIRLALSIGRAMTAGGGVGRVIRRVLVPQLHRLPGLSAKIVDSETPALHRSVLVHRSFAQRRLTGRLTPNPVVGDGKRFDTVVGDGFAFVTTAAPVTDDCRRIDAHGAALHVAAPGSEMADWLRRGNAAAAIVRPDRTVMRAGRDIGALCDVLPRFHSSATSPRMRSSP